MEKVGTVTVHDNGLRCFVPPCFCWELYTSKGTLVKTVSDIVFSPEIEIGNKEKEEILTRLKNGDFAAVGSVEEYFVSPVPNVSPAKGLRFIVEEVIKQIEKP